MFLSYNLATRMIFYTSLVYKNVVDLLVKEGILNVDYLFSMRKCISNGFKVAICSGLYDDFDV